MIISKTPLRLSFCGGGTDFPDFYDKYGGAVLSTTINKYIYVIVNPSFSDRIHVSYSKKETCTTLDQVKHDLVREAMRKAGITGGIEVTTMADIPSEGTGLGSSSSLTVGLLNAFYTYTSRDFTREQLAEDACDIEMNVLGKPIGKQDQYIAALGGLRLTQFTRENVFSELLRTNPLKRKLLSRELLLFYTGITRQSSSILTEQKRQIDSNRDLLLSIREGVMPMKAALLENRSNIGYHLDWNWRCKKELSPGISNSKIDTFYRKALRAGATGGKIAGAGGGGFLLLHCPPAEQDRVRDALSDLQELHFDFEEHGTHIILED